eukprot:g43325.t1
MKPTENVASQSFLSIIMEVLDDSTWERLDQLLSLDELTKTPEMISESLALLRDTITYVLDRGVDSCLISLDQEKAFDRILYTYMWDALSKMGSGEGIYIWIRLLYTNIVSAVSINGKDGSLRGVTIPGSGALQVKVSLYMDDVAIFRPNSLSVRGLMSICNQFELALTAKVLVIWFRGAGACAKTWEEHIAK